MRQRLFLHARLDRLSAKDTATYVEARLNKAELVSQRIFPTAVLSEIHVRTDGVPRLVNALCSDLLQICLERQTQSADLQMLDRVQVPNWMSIGRAPEKTCHQKTEAPLPEEADPYP